MIYLISKYYEYKLVDFKEAGFDWLVKFENTFDETIKFIENTNKLEKQRFHRERIVSIKKEQKIIFGKKEEPKIEDIVKAINSCKNICSELMYQPYYILKKDIINVFLSSKNIDEKMKNKIKLYFNIEGD